MSVPCLLTYVVPRCSDKTLTVGGDLPGPATLIDHEVLSRVRYILITLRECQEVCRGLTLTAALNDRDGLRGVSTGIFHLKHFPAPRYCSG